MGNAATIWSGYIFQGDVALCKALETIIQLGEDNIPDEYYLKLEEDEDFSINTNVLEVFQVKAYTEHNYTKYKEAWDKMMNNFPANTDNNYLYLHKDDIDLSKFDGVSNQDKLVTNVISGIYTLGNIYTKIDTAIRSLFPNLNDNDIEIKRCYCCNQISKKIKDRHRTKHTESILLSTIINWIRNCPEAFTEEIAWYEILKIFFQSLSEDLIHYDLTNEGQKADYNSIESCLVELNNLDFPELKNLLQLYLTPHKKLPKENLRLSFGNYIDGEVVKQVILKAIKKIKISPVYKKLQYVKKDNGDILHYQLLIHNNIFDVNDPIEHKNFQKHCEVIYKQPSTKDIDYFVTSNLDKEKEEVRSRLIEILDTEIKSEEKAFGFKKIDNAINEINNENTN